MKYDDLEFPEEENLAVKFKRQEEDKKERKVKVVDSKRYIITCDPYDEDTIRELRRGFNVFIIYDRMNQGVSVKVTTRKLFDVFVEEYLATEYSRVPYVVSHKFIVNGRPCNLGEANPGSEPSKRYIDTF